jgi:phage shock protein A
VTQRPLPHEHGEAALRELQEAHEEIGELSRQLVREYGIEADLDRELQQLREALRKIEQAANDGKSNGHIGYLARAALAAGGST